MEQPNYEAIFIANAIALVLLFGLFVSSYMTRERRHLDDRIFAMLIAVSAGACILEPLCWVADGTAEPWAFAVNYVGNTYVYLGSCICPYLWILYVDLRLHKGTDHIRSWHPIALVPVLILAAMDIGNLFGHYMFTIDENNVYSRQPLSYITYVLMLAQFLYSGWMKHKYEREHGKIHFFPMSMFLVPIFLGAAVQAVFFGISTAWPSVCVGLAIIHMSLQNELSYIDQLTNLYNRSFLDATLRRLERNGEEFFGIMADLDFFKEINDTFGHSIGDQALVQTASILVEAAGDDATVVRYAGDEFVILLTHADEQRASQVQCRLTEAIDEFNRTTETPYKLSLSTGSSAFVPGEDSVDDFLRRIDNRMYDQKRQRHRMREESRPLR